MINYHDAEFGPIRLEGSQWILERRAILGDRPVPLWVEFEAGQEGELSLLQREAIRQALMLPPDVLRTAAPVVLQNYEVYREAIAELLTLPTDNPRRSRALQLLVAWKITIEVNGTVEQEEGGLMTALSQAYLEWEHRPSSRAWSGEKARSFFATDAAG